MLKVFRDVAIGSGAVAGAGNTIGNRALLGVRLGVCLCIVGAIFDGLALLEVVLLPPLNAI